MVSLLNLLFGRCGCDFSQSVVNQAGLGLNFASKFAGTMILGCVALRSGVALSLSLKTWFA